jgi:hypothetical protein
MKALILKYVLATVCMVFAIGVYAVPGGSVVMPNQAEAQRQQQIHQQQMLQQQLQQQRQAEAARQQQLRQQQSAQQQQLQAQRDAYNQQQKIAAEQQAARAREALNQQNAIAAQRAEAQRQAVAREQANKEKQMRLQAELQAKRDAQKTTPATHNLEHMPPSVRSPNYATAPAPYKPPVNPTVQNLVTAKPPSFLPPSSTTDAQQKAKAESQIYDQISAAKAKGDTAKINSLINTLPPNSRGIAKDYAYGGATEIDMTPFVGGAGLAKGVIVKGGKIAVGVAAEEFAAYETKKAAQAAAAKEAEALLAKKSIPNIVKGEAQTTTSTAGTYRPPETLRRDPHGNPVPDSNTAHTQLGTRAGRNGNYTQGRTWEPTPNGNVTPKKDIDFTNHGRPATHTNPHEHEWIPNPSGGNMIRSKTPSN